jgi:hypothetical protein
MNDLDHGPVLAIGIGFLLPNAAAQSDPYPKMAPVEQYLMDRTAEIALARGARGRRNPQQPVRFLIPAQK